MVSLSAPGWKMIRRPGALLYGLLGYVVAVRAMIYLVGFCNGWVVPKGIDSGPAGERAVHLAVDSLLLAGFGLLHSLSARAGWKRHLERWLPKPLERSTYALLAGLSLSLVMWLWRPVAQPVWEIDGAWLRVPLAGVSVAGWIVCLTAINTLGHLDLFGLRPAYRFSVGKPLEDRSLVQRGLYRRVRNPLYAGFVIAVWAAPTMSVGHALFATLTTLYIAIGIFFEERDLARRYGAEYRAFRRRVPRFLPRIGSRPVGRSPSAGHTSLPDDRRH